MLPILSILALVFLAGGFGGLVNAILAGALELPKSDRTAGVWKPGWVANVLIGATAALVFWGLYGALADGVIVGGVANDATDPRPILKVRELLGAVLTGVGGGRVLMTEIDKRVLARERKELDATKSSLVETVRELSK